MKTILTTLIVIAAFTSFGQQEGQFMQMVNNPYILNPAAGGLTDVAQLELGIRSQWSGYSNRPQTYLLSGHSRIRVGTSKKVLSEFHPNKNAFFSSPEITGGVFKHVAGGMLLNETIGPFNRLTIQGSYAVHMPLYRDFSIGAGLSAGFNNFGIIQERVVLYQEDDDAYMQFLGGTGSQNSINMNGGLIVYHPKFMFSFSTVQLLKNNVIFGGIETASHYSRHFYFMTNYGIDINDEIEVRPTVIAKVSENTPFNLNAAIKVTYDRSAWLMMGYRSNGSLNIQLGANLVKQLYLAYGYEHGIGKLQVQGNGTHEIQIGYYLGKNRNIDKELKKGPEE